MNRPRTDRVLRRIEQALLSLGSVSLLWVGAESTHALTYQVGPAALFDRLDPVTDHLATESDRSLVPPPPEAAAPIGRLEIPRIGLSAHVLEGDDNDTLKVAVGHLPDTPLPWEEGNAALAGHRDTFFRPLRRIRSGDEISLVTPRGTFRYRATRHVIVDPGELWVLAPSPTAALTLITCYPFHFVGPAPRRFVVHAERIVETARR